MTDRPGLAGYFWLSGGVAWMIAAGIGAGAADSSARFYVAEVIWLAAQLLLLAALIGLRRLRPDDGLIVGRIGFGVAILGRLVFVAAEILSLGTGAESEAVLPVGAILTAFGMIMVGIATLRAHHWTGWSRFAPLAVGVYPFLFMFPLVVMFAAPEIGVALWALPAIGLGFAVMGAPAPARVGAASTAA